MVFNKSDYSMVSQKLFRGGVGLETFKNVKKTFKNVFNHGQNEKLGKK